jgi:hypothetical protein
MDQTDLLCFVIANKPQILQAHTLYTYCKAVRHTFTDEVTDMVITTFTSNPI